jgi:hypothetical protein
MTLPCTHIYEILVHMKMSINRLKYNSLIHSHNTRSMFDLFITGHTTKLFEQFCPQWCAHFQQTIQWKKTLGL